MSLSIGAGAGGHGAGFPSDWVLRWSQAWRDRDGATALDLACGAGRHLRLLAGDGVAVTGVDRDAQALAGLAGTSGRVELIEADIEHGPWPLEGRAFDVVIVTNYLWRPLLPRVVASVAPGGWLIYETFTDGQQSIGRPARPEFLLRPGELLAAVEGLRVVAYEDGFLEADLAGDAAATVNGRYVQRVAAVRPRAGADTAADAAANGAAPGVYPRYRLR
ncbi:class I SAM-dependent methyltransferase [Mitsuaria sp. GD03876]|uniref:class I SAM-dependent methyltransferase n=1 Tax=Mitsuaria sp. GD03876 TaxID=2975399 RepID=UPI0024468E70|nr:class I SAM-dependent methyltransferase [Mitsuaria sp. GD03876]MDH0865915.1 class I SAM-dependent methyltransferase [Mitsuaria sp. GD03876]